MNNYKDIVDNIKPTTSDDDFMTSVMVRSQKRKISYTRKLSVTFVVVIGLMALTITAGAVNDWDYAALIRNIFNNNPVVIDSMDNDVNYEIVSNTFDGLSFEISAVYADMEALFLIVNITSDEPLFNESHEISVAATGPLRLGDGFKGWPEFALSQFSYYVINEYHLVTAMYFVDPVDRETFPVFADHVPAYLESVIHYKDVITSGRYFSILFDGDDENVSFPVSNGRAEIRFTVDAIDEQNVLLLNPDVMLDNGIVLDEIRINPFSITIRYSGDRSSLVSEFSGYPKSIDSAMGVSILLKNGSIKPIVMLNNGGSVSGGWFNDEAEISWSILLLNYDHLLVIDEISAIIFDNIKIPVN